MLLDVKEIDTYYDIFQAIFKVSLNVREKEVVCVLGRNGAGKTTTLSSIIGLNRPRSGSVLFKGKEIAGAQVLPDRTVGDRLCAGASLDLFRSHGKREPGAGLEGEKAEEHVRRNISAFPETEGPANAKGRKSERRRTADAHHRQNSYGGA